RGAGEGQVRPDRVSGDAEERRELGDPGLADSLERGKDQHLLAPSTAEVIVALPAPGEDQRIVRPEVAAAGRQAPAAVRGRHPILGVVVGSYERHDDAADVPHQVLDAGEADEDVAADLDPERLRGRPAERAAAVARSALG